MSALITAGDRREVNFGGNLAWQTRCYRPASEAEVLDILAQHAGDRIRVLGSKHSWSDIAVSGDVSLDMSRFDDVQPFVQDEQKFVRVGAGATLQSLLDRLHRATDQTLPTLGAIKKQTISGAISTGTHGSGRQSLSHFATRVRLAAYDPGTGRPMIYDYTDGDGLRAARCGLGCMGVILSVELRTVPKYKVAEVLRKRGTLKEILDAYADRPLTQFLWTPYGWKWIAFERRPMGQPTPTMIGFVKARVMRLYKMVGQDILFHLLVIASRWGGGWAVKGFQKLAPRIVLKNVERIDDAEHVLTLRHDYFRHEEMEIFVRESRLEEAIPLLRGAVEVFAGNAEAIPHKEQERLKAIGVLDELLAHRGRYVHHYPLVFRRMLPEDTLVSMAASLDEPIYSISLFTYDPPWRRERYYEFCSVLARILRTRLEARLHWGKHFPLQLADIAGLYPEMETFRELCRRHDPRGVFRNDYTERVLGLAPGGLEQAR
jgi:L-gulono-1,4-lactone dehydrogenase